jgi:Rad3-related DNA helicase
MDDRDVLARIDDLVREEHELRDRSGEQGLSDDQRARLRQVEEQLDQAWDLLRQRRAREEFGEDPGAAKPRPVGEVEGYLQ